MTSPDAASVVDILDQLIDIVRSARSVPMSASAMVNRSQVVELRATFFPISSSRRTACSPRSTR